MSVDFLDVFLLQQAREVATSASQAAGDAQRVSAGTRRRCVWCGSDTVPTILKRPPGR